MAKFTKIVAQYKKMQADLNKDEAENTMDSLSDNYHEVLRLKKINQHLEIKINRLYNMLGGDESELVAREKQCDDKARKILGAINKLKQAKKEITQLIDSTYGRISELERKERFLLEEIRKLREENSKLHKNIQQLHEDNPYIFSESENLYKEDAQKTSSKLNTSISKFDDFSKPKDTKTEQRLDNIESKVDTLSDQISQIHEYLKMLSHPSSAHLVEDSLYNQLEEFLES